jgi:hypothetical protein
MAKVKGKSDYQQAIESSDDELLDTDDEQDISETEESTATKGTVKKSTLEDDVDEDESNVDDEEEEIEEDVDSHVEPSYKKEQVQKIVQTRVNTYNKRIKKLQPYKEAVDKICEVTGLDFDKLVSRLTNMSDEEQSKILGIPVTQISQTRKTRQEITDERGKNQLLSRQLEESQLKADPKFQDFDLFKEEIDDLIEENPKLSLKQAYLLARGDNAIRVAARDGEQRAIAKRVKEAQTKGVVKASGPIASPGPKLDKTIVSAAKKIGMDPAEYAAYQNVDNIEAYRAMKKARKKE